jgi:hypothetical protein
MIEPARPRPRAKQSPPLSLKQRAAQLAEEERLTTGDVRRAFIKALLGCAASVLVALGLIGWALHTTDPGWGQIAFLSGLIIGYGGIVITLARYYLRGEEQGWWH